MKKERTLATQNLQSELRKAKSERTLDIAKRIVSGQENMPYLEMGLSIDKNLDRPTMRSVFKNELGQISFAVTQALVTRFVDSFGFSTKLNAVQLEMLTVDAIEKFEFEPLEDMILFFKYARSGRYGETIRGLDSNLIFGKWFPLFMEEKARVRENHKDTEKNKYTALSVSPEDLKLTYDKIKAQQLHKDRIEYIDKITSEMDRQMLDDTIITWEKDEKTKPYVRYLKSKRTQIK